MKAALAFIFGAVTSLLIRLEITPSTSSFSDDITYFIEDDDTNESSYSDNESLYTNFNVDNPFISDDDVYSTAFIYETLQHAMLSVWPAMATDIPAGFEALEAIVKGVWSLFTTVDIEGDYAILFEAMRLMQDTLIDFTHTDLVIPNLTVSSIDIAVEIDTFFEHALNGNVDIAVNVARAVEARFRESNLAEGTGVQTLTVATLASIARNWSMNEWPEFAEAIDFDDEGDE